MVVSIHKMIVSKLPLFFSVFNFYEKYIYDEYKHRYEIYDEFKLFLIRSILTLNESNSGNGLSNIKENLF